MRTTFILMIAIAFTFSALCCFAAPRSTPVEVINAPTVSFDPSGNTVKSEQSGTWSVGLLSSANTVKLDTSANTVKFDATANTVKAQQNGTWTVGLLSSSNTVKFDPTGNAVKSEQSGAWTVGIDPAANTVKTEPVYSKVTLFAGYNAVLQPGERHDTAAIDCRGFKEIRILINYNSGSGTPPRVGLSAKSPTGDYYYDVGYFSGTFGLPNFTSGEYVGQGNQIWFSAPVVSDYMKVWIKNNLGSQVTCWGGYSYAYLID